MHLPTFYLDTVFSQGQVAAFVH